MSRFSEWQQANRKRFPNAVLFFDIFKEVQEEIQADVIKGAYMGVAGSGVETIITKKIPGPYGLAISALVGAGFTAGGHVIDAVKELTSHRPREVYDFSILAYTNDQRSSSIFYDYFQDSLGADAVKEVGTTIPLFEENLIKVIINEEKTFSEQTMQAFEKNLLNLPARKLGISLTEELDRQGIYDSDERQLYSQALAQSLQDELGLGQKDKPQLSAMEQKRLGFARSVMEKEAGLVQRLANARDALKKMSQDTAEAIRAGREKNKRDFEFALHSFKFIQTLGQITDNPGLQKAGIIGEQSYKIISEVARLKDLAVAGVLTVGTFAGSVSIIGIAGHVILKLFKKKKTGPDPQTVMINQLRDLSQKMEVFRYEVMQQFMQAHNNQRIIYEAVCQGFDLIYFSIKSENEELRYSVISRLEDIQGHLHYLEDRIGDGFRELGTQSLLKSIAFIEREYGKYQKNKASHLSVENFETKMDELTFWLISHEKVQAYCKSPILTGASALPREGVYFQANHYKRVVNLLSGDPIQLGQTLGFLVPYAKRYLLENEKAIASISAFGDPVDIGIWSYIVDSYIKLRILGAQSEISYDEDNSELKIILQDADNILDLLTAFQGLKCSIFKAITKQYNEAIETLKTALKEKIESVLTKEVVRLGPSTMRLSLQAATANIFGKEVSLVGSNMQDVAIPEKLVLAQRFGLGKFAFRGDRSERIAGSVRRHSNHNLGVSAVYPSARYHIDLYFEFSDGRKPIYLASGTKYVHGAQDDTNPGNRKFSHIADANYARCVATLNAWNAKSDADFFREMWEQDNHGLSFTLQSSNEMKMLLDHINLEGAVLKEKLDEIVASDPINEIYLRLNFLKTLISAYASMIGNANRNSCDHLAFLKSGDEIRVSLQNLKLSNLKLESETVDSLCNSFTSRMMIESGQKDGGEVAQSLQSPLAYPIIEQISGLSLFSVKKSDGIFLFGECYSENHALLEASSDIAESRNVEVNHESSGWWASLPNLGFPGANALSFNTLVPIYTIIPLSSGPLLPLSERMQNTLSSSALSKVGITPETQKMNGLQTAMPHRMNQKIFDLTREVNQDPRAGVPLFIFKAFDSVGQAGHITLYGHPIVCRSEDGLHHNVVEKKGIFESWTIKVDELTEICEALPLDEAALRYQSMARSSLHGALRGTANVMEKGLYQQGFSQETSRYTANATYYFAYWLLSFMQHYQNENELGIENTQAVFKAAMSACYDVLYLLMLSTIFSGVSVGFQGLSQEAKNIGWTRTAQTFSFFAQHAPKLIYAQNLKEEGIVNTALNIGSGVATQKAVEYLGSN